MDPVGRIPRLTGRSGRLFGRKAFLDGTVRAYFGPGQRASMIGGFDPTSHDGYYMVGNAALDDVYTKPTDWSAANTLLRPTQVVWLEYMAAFLGASETENPFYYELTSEAGPEYQIQQNLGWTEHERLAPIFDAAKAQIEALRPGITFVEVQDWNRIATGSSYTYFAFPGEGTGPQIDGYWPAFDDGTAAWTDSGAAATSGAGFIRAPAFPGNFFGTDFLHLYVGDAILSRMLLAQLSVIWHQGGSPSLPDAGGFWAVAYARLKASMPHFTRYASRLYGFGFQAYHPWDTGDNPFFQTNINNDYLSCLNWTASLFDDAESLAAQDGIDIRHAGSSFDLGSADAILDIVAAHYRFDPQTGLDLPIG